MAATQVNDPALTLESGETAWRMDGGQLVTVRVTQLPSPDGYHLPLFCEGRQLNEDGTTKMVQTPFDPAPVPVRLPSSTHSIQHAALANGQTSVAQEFARIVALALTQWENHLAAMTAIANLPAYSPPAS